MLKLSAASCSVSYSIHSQVWDPEKQSQVVNDMCTPVLVLEMDVLLMLQLQLVLCPVDRMQLITLLNSIKISNLVKQISKAMARC